MGQEVAACSAIIIAMLKKKRKPREVWMKSWLINKDTKSAYNTILEEFRLDDRESFRRYLRMDTGTFDELVCLVTPMIEAKCTRLWKALDVEEKLTWICVFLEMESRLLVFSINFRYRKQRVCSVIYGVKRRMSTFSKGREGMVRYLKKYL